MHSTEDMVHAVVLSTLDVTAILVNFILIFAILTRTPPSMRSYSILLLNNTCVDILSASGSMLATARCAYLRGGSELYVYIGACSQVGVWFCHLCHTIHTFFVCHSTLVLLHSFCFRLYILRDKLVDVKVPSTRTTLLICMALYAPTLIMIFGSDRAIVRQGMRMTPLSQHLYYTSFEIPPMELLITLNFEQYPASWHPDITDWRFASALSVVCILSPSAMAMIFFVRMRLLREIRQMDSGAKDHHSHIARALSCQMLLPLGLALACAAWMAEIIGILSGEIAERLVMTLCSLFALGSPLINLTFLPPYRSMFGDGVGSAINEVSTMSYTM